MTFGMLPLGVSAEQANMDPGQLGEGGSGDIGAMAAVSCGLIGGASLIPRKIEEYSTLLK